MKLALFDVDDTLTHTQSIDEICFVRAFSEEFGIKEIDTDWSNYPSVTDSAITRQILQEFLGRTPHATETMRIRLRFLRLLEEAATQDREITEVPSATAALESLKGLGWSIALATGGWRDSAMLKLSKAGLAVDGLVLASADDAETREQIVQLAITRAADKLGISSFQKLVYVGDAVWDMQVCKRLGISFVEIGLKSRELHEEGASCVLADYLNLTAFIEAVESAPPMSCEKLNGILSIKMERNPWTTSFFHWWQSMIKIE